MAESRPPVGIVGAGAVAQTLGRLMAAAGEPIVAVASRTRDRAERAARFIGADRKGSAPVRVVAGSELPRMASRILIAVTDSAVERVAEMLADGGMRSGVALHTCGAKGPEALRPLARAGVACGMLHPLQTIVTPEQGVASLAEATFGISGEPGARQWARAIARIVTGADDRFLEVDADRLSYYHAGAVMASNAIVALLDAAVALLGQAGVERGAAMRALAPLAGTTVWNTVAAGPEAALTGPIVRGDAATVAMHMRALKDGPPTVARLYEAAAAHLLTLARQRGLSDASAREIEDLVRNVRL